MDPSLQPVWDEFVANHERFLQALHAFAPADLRKKPSPDEWNALQVVDHLQFAEGGALKFWNKRPLGTYGKNAGFIERIKGFVLKRALYTKRKFKLPPSLPDPKDDKSLDEFLRDWENIHKQLKAHIDAWKPEFKNQAVFVHPVVGPIGMKETLAFLASHKEHHLYQLERIAEAI